MRYIKDLDNQFCKTSLYSFNNKYVIKFEVENLEQIYKFSEQDVFEPEAIIEHLNEDFYLKIMSRFELMAQDYVSIMNDIDGY